MIAGGKRGNHGQVFGKGNLGRTMRTDKATMVAMIFDDVAAAGNLVQAVYVLCYDSVEKTEPLQLAQGQMGWGGFGLENDLCHLPEHGPHFPRVSMKRPDMGVLHGIVLLPETLSATEGRYPCVYRYAGTGEGSNVAQVPDQLCNLPILFHVTFLLRPTVRRKNPISGLS